MVIKSIILASLMMVDSANGEVTMNGQTIDGDILDNRITACGVRIAYESFASIRPFIETSAEVSGNFSISVAKRSRSGTSMSTQAKAFSGGTLGNNALAVDIPSMVRIEMSVTSADGSPLCSLDREIELAEPAIRL